jgi:hypothetical protein
MEFKAGCKEVHLFKVVQDKSYSLAEDLILLGRHFLFWGSFVCTLYPSVRRHISENLKPKQHR